jgi:FixJ family two-component response regulator
MPGSRFDRLTLRQKDCLRLVAQGYTSKEIGRELGISYSTVDNHLLAATQAPVHAACCRSSWRPDGRSGERSYWAATA